MKNRIADLSLRKAAIIVGIAFIIMFPLGIFGILPLDNLIGYYFFQ